MLASAQIMLDRGERADWFDSAEIVTWAAIAGLALYAFIVHSATAERPFLDPRLLADRNFSVGIVLIFVFGMLNFTPMTLLPPMLQGVSGYPDSVIGFVLGARGLGTLLGFFLMVYASRLDPRGMIWLGLQAAASPLAARACSIEPEHRGRFWPRQLQGFGVGVLLVPITMVASPPSLRLPRGGPRRLPHGAQHRLEIQFPLSIPSRCNGAPELRGNRRGGPPYSQSLTRAVVSAQESADARGLARCRAKWRPIDHDRYVDGFVFLSRSLSWFCAGATDKDQALTDSVRFDCSLSQAR